MIIDCISDLHGYYPELEGGDLLIVAGDLTASDEQRQYLIFREWICRQNYRKKIFISGNHDGCIQDGLFYFNDKWMGAEYLYDSEAEFEGLKIWGSPWTRRFSGMNPSCMAFTGTEDELEGKFRLIPDDVDILITHSPPLGVMDEVGERSSTRVYTKCVGSEALYQQLYSERIKPRLHVFGHIHEGYGIVNKMLDLPYTKFVNCSHVNEFYEPINKPIRVIL